VNNFCRCVRRRNADLLSCTFAGLLSLYSLMV
jgi:hypothetical protein